MHSVLGAFFCELNSYFECTSAARVKPGTPNKEKKMSRMMMVCIGMALWLVGCANKAARPDGWVAPQSAALPAELDHEALLGRPLDLPPTGVLVDVHCARQGLDDERAFFEWYGVHNCAQFVSQMRWGQSGQALRFPRHIRPIVFFPKLQPAHIEWANTHDVILRLDCADHPVRDIKHLECIGSVSALTTGEPLTKLRTLIVPMMGPFLSHIPQVRVLALNHVPPEHSLGLFKSLATLKHLKTLWLDFSSRTPLPADWATQLALAPSLESLRIVTSSQTVDAGALRALARPGRLRALTLHKQAITAAHINALQSSPGLTYLTLNLCSHTQASVDEIGLLSGLRALSLDNTEADFGTFSGDLAKNSLSDIGLWGLVRGVGLRELNLLHMGLSGDHFIPMIHLQLRALYIDEFFRAEYNVLPHIRHMSHLGSLRWDRAFRDNDTPHDLALLKRLRVLTVALSSQESDLFSHLRGLDVLRGLYVLRREENYKTSTIVLRQLDALTTKQLRTLVLYSPLLYLDGAQDLIDLPELRRLDLGNTVLTQPVLDALDKMPRLEDLTIDCNHTVATKEMLGVLGRLPHLRALYTRRGLENDQTLLVEQPWASLRVISVSWMTFTPKSAAYLNTLPHMIHWYSYGRASNSDKGLNIRLSLLRGMRVND